MWPMRFLPIGSAARRNFTAQPEAEALPDNLARLTVVELRAALSARGAVLKSRQLKAELIAQLEALRSQERVVVQPALSDRTALLAMTNVQLRAMLREQKLSTVGVKAVLVDRLHAHQSNSTSPSTTKTKKSKATKSKSTEPATPTSEPSQSSQTSEPSQSSQTSEPSQTSESSIQSEPSIQSPEPNIQTPEPNIQSTATEATGEKSRLTSSGAASRLVEEEAAPVDLNSRRAEALSLVRSTLSLLPGVSGVGAMTEAQLWQTMKRDAWKLINSGYARELFFCVAAVLQEPSLERRLGVDKLLEHSSVLLSDDDRCLAVELTQRFGIGWPKGPAVASVEALLQPESPTALAACWSVHKLRRLSADYEAQLVQQTLAKLPVFDIRSMVTVFEAAAAACSGDWKALRRALVERIMGERHLLTGFELSVAYAGATYPRRNLSLLALLGELIEDKSAALACSEVVRLVDHFPRSLPGYLPRKRMLARVFDRLAACTLTPFDAGVVLLAMSRLHASGAFLADAAQVDAVAKQWRVPRQANRLVPMLAAVAGLPPFDQRAAVIADIVAALAACDMTAAQMADVLRAMAVLSAVNKQRGFEHLAAHIGAKLDTVADDLRSAELQLARSHLALLLQ